MESKMEKEIKKLINKGESNTLEFKESLRLKDEVGETVSAFSNTDKGIILVGVSDSGRVVGVQIGKNTVEDIANFIKQYTDNHVYPKITSEIVDSKDILVINVEESDEKPVFFKSKAYKRIGKSTHKLSASEIRKLAKESTRSLWDEQICEDSMLSDIDKRKVHWYLEEREEHRNISKTLKISLKKFLENIKAVKNGKPTNAGILFFSKEPLIKIISAQLRVVRIKGTFIANTILDRLDCEGTLWEMIEQAEGFFKKHINFMGFRTEKSFQRDDRFDIPVKALRELMINALIHRDYETNADVRVFIFDDRVEIINPGSFPKGVTPKNPRHEPVNKILSQYMYDIGFIEKYGSGITAVRSMLMKNGNKEQKYVIHEMETKAIVYSQVYEKRLNNKSSVESSVKSSVKILGLIKENKEMSIPQIASFLKLSTRAVEKNIANLKKKGLLKRVGPAKGGYWEAK